MVEATSLIIGDVSFSCVPLGQADLRNVAAVYVVICVREDRSWTALDVGQSGEVGTRIDSHDRRDCWTKNCPTGNIWVCVYQMPADRYTKEQRLEFETKLRRLYDPTCGKT